MTYAIPSVNRAAFKRRYRHVVQTLSVKKRLRFPSPIGPQETWRMLLYDLLYGNYWTRVLHE